MSRVVIIENGVVTNAIEADLAWAQQHYPQAEVREHELAGPGWILVDEELQAPPTEPEPEPLPTGGMTRLAFTRRFTLAERISIRQSTDPIVIDGMAMLEVAEEIKLDDPDTIALIGYFVTQGLLTQERADEILQQEM